MSLGPKKTIIILVTIVLGVILLTSLNSIFETNKNGHYQIKQAALTGKMTVRMNAGIYAQNFGSIWTYRSVATVGFGEQKGEGSADIPTIKVIFNDGSKADISGLVRVGMPTDPDKLLAIKQKWPDGYEHFIRSGIIPIVTNSVKLSANLRSAQDAYTTIALFQQAVEDQLTNGIYSTRSDVKEFVRSTGDIEQIKVTEIVKDKNGEPIRISNRLSDLGCTIEECVISSPAFDAQVEEIISKRKEEAMKTELAKQEAIRAKQETITAQEKGKAKVAEARAAKQVEKIKAVTDAEKEFEVAKLNKMKAKEEAEAELIKGRAKAKKNQLLVSAGLTPKTRAEIDKATAIGVATQLAKLQLPKTMVFGGGKGSPLNPFDAVGLKAFMKITEDVQRAAQSK